MFCVPPSGVRARFRDQGADAAAHVDPHGRETVYLWRMRQGIPTKGQGAAPSMSMEGKKNLHTT